MAAAFLTPHARATVPCNCRRSGRRRAGPRIAGPIFWVRCLSTPRQRYGKNLARVPGRFIGVLLVRAGVRFWRNRRGLAAEQEGGDAGIIVLVEDIYGQQMGNFHVMNALATLAFGPAQGSCKRTVLGLLNRTNAYIDPFESAQPSRANL